MPRTGLPQALLHTVFAGGQRSRCSMPRYTRPGRLFRLVKRGCSSEVRLEVELYLRLRSEQEMDPALKVRLELVVQLRDPMTNMVEPHKACSKTTAPRRCEPKLC